MRLARHFLHSPFIIRDIMSKHGARYEGWMRDMSSKSHSPFITCTLFAATSSKSCASYERGIRTSAQFVTLSAFALHNFRHFRTKFRFSCTTPTEGTWRNVSQFAFLPQNLHLFCTKWRAIPCKKGASYEGRMRLAWQFPHSPFITARPQKVHIMRGDCEMRDISCVFNTFWRSCSCVLKAVWLLFNAFVLCFSQSVSRVLKASWVFFTAFLLFL